MIFKDLGQALPLPTQILLSVSVAVQEYWWVIAAVILVTVLGYRGELTIIAVVVSISALIMLLPIAGEPNFGPLVAIEEFVRDAVPPLGESR